MSKTNLSPPGAPRRGGGGAQPLKELRVGAVFASGGLARLDDESHNFCRFGVAKLTDELLHRYKKQTTSVLTFPPIRSPLSGACTRFTVLIPPN